MNDFIRDNEWQKSVRDTVLGPYFYGVYAVKGRYVFIDKGRLAETLQKRFAVDTILQGKDNSAICIEEKIVRWPGYQYQNCCLETHSCTRPGRESDGWMRYAKSDYLLYCFHQQDNSLLTYLFDFPKLQDWFWKNENKFETFGPLNTLNASMGKKVPLEEICANVPAFRNHIKPGLEAVAA